MIQIGSHMICIYIFFSSSTLSTKTSKARLLIQGRFLFIGPLDFVLHTPSGRSGRESPSWKSRISHLEIRIFCDREKRTDKVFWGGSRAIYTLHKKQMFSYTSYIFHLIPLSPVHLSPKNINTDTGLIRRHGDHAGLAMRSQLQDLVWKIMGDFSENSSVLVALCVPQHGRHSWLWFSQSIARLPQSKLLHTNKEVIFLDIVYCIIFVLFSRSQRNYSLDNSWQLAGG